MMSLACKSQATFKTSPGVSIPITSIGFTSTALGLYLQSDLDTLSQDILNMLDRKNIPSFDQISTYNSSQSSKILSDYLLTLNILMPFGLLLDNQINDYPMDYSAIYLESLLLNVGLNTLTKNIVTRSRPFLYNQDFPAEDKFTKDARLSFYSGHTSLSFGSAVFTSFVYGESNPNSEYKGYIWAFTLSSASLTAYLRISAGKHFPSDVITGAIIGSTIGYIVPYLHRNIKENKNPIIYAPDSFIDFKNMKVRSYPLISFSF